MTGPTTQQAAGEQDGRHDFDFLFGDWEIANRRLEDPLSPAASRWREFTSTARSRPILGGLGNADTYLIPEFPGHGRFHGFALRLFQPSTALWRIWWASTAADGQLDTPVVGRFVGGRGRFECDDVIRGRAVVVRFDWTDITPTSARWEQSFSFDGGQSFAPNWVMRFTRSRGAA
jgi:hypothetical protein